ncbi:MAG: hypothetical protein HY295_04110 [Thaumarchaeota archaeon]|nr:hypothetical protein [Nitrososphaerota archaeon]
MSTHSEHWETERKHHEGLLPIGSAFMMICTLVAIFVIAPEKGGYAGGDNPLAFFEVAGLLVGSVLIGYIALVFRAV